MTLETVKRLLKMLSEHKIKGTTLTLVGFLVLRYVYILWKRKKQRQPPGPIGLPLIGCAHMRGSKGDFGLKLALQYGPICQVKMGPSLIYLINHSELVKQIIMEHHVIDRPKINPNNFNPAGIDSNVPSFAQLNGEQWKQRRRLALSLLANIPSNILETIVNDGLTKVLYPKLDEICQTNGKWYINEEVVWYAFNTIHAYNVGNIIENANDPFIRDYVLSFKKGFVYGMNIVWYNMFPFFKKLPSFDKFQDNRIKRTNMIRELIERRINYKKENIDNDNKNEETYIDVMLKHEKEGKITRDELLADIHALFAAGTETTSSTLHIAVLLLAKYPMVTQNMSKILLSLWKYNGSPMTQDGKHRIYSLKWKLDSKTKNESNRFCAFINEIFRITTTAPRGVNHSTMNKSFDINVKKEYGTPDGKDHTYFIPKNTVIVYNSEYIHKYSSNEKWKHKQGSDRPCLENWLKVDPITKENELVKSGDMPYTLFGVGNRICVGQRLAQNEVELFLATLILNYNISFDCKEPQKVEIKTKQGITVTVINDPPLSVKISRVVE